VPESPALLVLIGGAFAGSVVGGVAGFGAGVILLPLLAWTVGLRAAVPVLTVTMLLGNVSRIWWSRGDVDRRVALSFLAGAVPATALGAALFATASNRWLSLTIGAFLMGSVPLRRLLASPRFRVRLAHFPLVGSAVGVLSALVVTTGAVVTPFILAYGLRRGAYIGTEAVCAAGMHVARGIALARYRLLTLETVALGLVLGGVMFAGAWVGRRLLDRMSERGFLVLVEALLLVMGAQFLLFPR
jgi:hypothetical protein